MAGVTNHWAEEMISFVLVMLIVALMMGYANRAQFDYVVQEPVIAEPSVVAAAEDPKAHAQIYREQQIAERFDQAVAMLHAKRYNFAVKALNRVIELAPRMPEAHVNMGYALIGLEDYKGAVNSFDQAIELKPYQANAYWGLAIASEQLEDFELALGSMRTYIHLSPPNDPFLRKARSALWEWDSALKRGPLPEEEKVWIERRTKEWVERNGPEADS